MRIGKGVAHLQAAIMITLDSHGGVNSQPESGLMNIGEVAFHAYNVIPDELFQKCYIQDVIPALYVLHRVGLVVCRRMLYGEVPAFLPDEFQEADIQANRAAFSCPVTELLPIECVPDTREMTADFVRESERFLWRSVPFGLSPGDIV